MQVRVPVRLSHGFARRRLATDRRSPVADWLPRALLVTLVALGTLFAAIGIWQAHTRTLFFGRDVEVANAYTSFFRVTSLFKDPSLYGRYLVVPIAVLLVAILVRRGRTLDWVVATAFVAFLFVGLFYSYSQSSFVALFVVTFAVAVVGGDRRTRIVLLACALVATLAAAGVAGAAIGGRSAKDVTSGRSRLVDGHARRVPGAPGRGSRRRRPAARELGDRPEGITEPERVAHEPLTVLAELGVIGFALYLWLLAATVWALVLVSRTDRTFAVGLGAVLLALVVHSLLYAGFFEDPLTWGVIGLTAAALATAPERSAATEPATDTAPAAPELLAH